MSEPESLTAKGIEELQNELWDAGETIGALEHARDTLTEERDRARLELQRLRERSSVEAAEAKVQYARLQRAHDLQVKMISSLEGRCNILSLEVEHHRLARADLINTLMGLIEAYSETSEA